MINGKMEDIDKIFSEFYEDETEDIVIFNRNAVGDAVIWNKEIHDIYDKFKIVNGYYTFELVFEEILKDEKLLKIYEKVLIKREKWERENYFGM